MTISQAGSEYRRNLPAGWRWARLGDVCERSTGTRDPRLQPDRMFRYVDIAAVDNKSKRIIGSRILSGREAPSRARQIIREGDVILATTRPNLNAVAVVPPELDDQICSTGFCILRPLETLDKGYLFAFVQSPRFVTGLSDLVKGALYPAVTDLQVLGREFPLPPLAEQKRIAAILNKQMAVVDRARTAAEAQLEAAKALPPAYLREVFDGVEAQQWPKRTIQDCCQLLPSKSIASDGDAEVDVVTTACLSESGFQPAGVKTGRMRSRDVADCILRLEEILIARSNTPELVGRAAMYPGGDREIVAADLTIRIKAGEGVVPLFLSFYLSYLYLTGYWKGRAGGASGSMKKITRGQILGENVPIPPLLVQRRSAGFLADMMTTADRSRKVTDAQLKEINKLPAALLRRAFSGDI